MKTNTLYVGCSQNHLIPCCKEFMRQHDFVGGLPYLLIMPNGARDLVRYEGTLKLLRSIGSTDPSGQSTIERIILALKDSERYEHTLFCAHMIARTIFPNVEIEPFRAIVPDDIAPLKNLHVYVRCMDGRLASACKKTRERLHLENGMHDVLSYPGGGGNHSWLDQDMRRYHDKGVQVTRIVITTHDDCKAGKSEADLELAEHIVRFYFPNAEIICEHFRQHGDEWHSCPSGHTHWHPNGHSFT